MYQVRVKYNIRCFTECDPVTLKYASTDIYYGWIFKTLHLILKAKSPRPKREWWGSILCVCNITVWDTDDNWSYNETEYSTCCHSNKCNMQQSCYRFELSKKTDFTNTFTTNKFLEYSYVLRAWCDSESLIISGNIVYENWLITKHRFPVTK